MKAWRDTQLSLASELKSLLPEQAKGVAPALVTAMLTGVGANPVALGVGVGVGLGHARGKDWTESIEEQESVPLQS